MQKKLNKKEILTCTVVVALMLVASVVLFAACGGSSPVGTWTVDRIVVDGVTIRSTDIDKQGQDSLFNNQITLNDGKTGSVKLGDNSPVEATWAQENTTITIRYGSSEYTYTLSGGELMRTEGTTKIFYKKSA